MTKLRISPDLALPEAAVTSTDIVLGGKGMGKTNFGSVYVEELTKAGMRWAVLDPMGVWWGVRHSKDGKGPGIPCVILGGVHGDIPIEPTGGAVVADLVVDERANVIIDFSRWKNGKMWTQGERIRFVTDYIRHLFERQGSTVGGQRREPIKQILDEAARYIPQTIPHGSVDLAKCVGAWEQACEEGRNIGLGVAFLTLRSARINKSVTELADMMIAFRTIGPNSLAAVMDWLGEHVEKGRIREISSQIRELNVGQALVISPGWLRIEKIVQIRQRETFDSSATPKPGERQQKVSGAAAKPDLAKYQAAMVETIEKAKADDPKELRKQLKEKDAEIARLQKAKAPAAAQVVDQRAIDRVVAAAVKPYVQREERGRRDVDRAATTARQLAETLERVAVALGEDVAGAVLSGRANIADVLKSSAVSAPRPPAPDRPAISLRSSSGSGDASLPKGERICLTAIASYDDGVERDQLSILSGFKRSTRDAYVQRLVGKGLAELRGTRIVATQAGLDALGSDYEPLPTGTALAQYWLARLPEGESKVLGVLLDGASHLRDEISDATGYKRSTRDAYIQRLGTRRLISTDSTGVRARAELFD
jgi:hypothetical protein